MSRFLGLRKNDKGQSMVEFALILPVLLLLLLGIIQFGIIFSAHIAITNAAREGARVASVGASRQEIVGRMNNSIGGHIFIPQLVDVTNVVINPDPSNGVEGNKITVRVKDVKLKLFVPVPNVFTTNDEVPLDAEASMRLEKKYVAP